MIGAKDILEMENPETFENEYFNNLGEITCLASMNLKKCMRLQSI